MTERYSSYFEVNLDARPDVKYEVVHQKGNGDQIIARLLAFGAIKEEDTQRAAAMFKYVFDNEWPECALCANCDSHFTEAGESPHRIPAKEALLRNKLNSQEYQDKNGYIPLEVTTSHLVLPTCKTPNCQRQMEHFHDLEAVMAKFKKRLLEGGRGFISELFIRPNSNAAARLFGSSIADFGPLGEIVKSEWRPYAYMKNPPEGLKMPDIALIVDTLRDKVDGTINADSEVLINSGISILPQFRGRGYGARMELNILNNIPREERENVFLAEVIENDAGFKLAAAAGGVVIPGALSHNRSLMGAKIAGAAALERKLMLGM